MTITIHAQGAERKRLVQTISDWLGVPAKYCGAPTFNYEVDYFTIRNAHLAPSPRLYRRRVQDRKRAPHEAPGWGCSLPQRQSSRLKDAAQRPPNPLMAGFRW